MASALTLSRSLRRLTIRRCEDFVDLSLFGSCTALQQLNLGLQQGEGYNSLGLVFCLAALDYLQLRLLVKTITPLASCTALKYLKLGSCYEVEDVTFL
jgi:hypothetical protein